MPSSSEAAFPPITRRDVAVLAIVVAALVLYALSQGQSAAWDLRNYHLYAAWALLEGRHDVDVAAAQMQTWFNPALLVPIHAAVTTWPPWLSTAALALVQSLNVVLAWGIARRIVPAAAQGRLAWLPLAAAACGALGASAIGELGDTQGDNLVSLSLLGGVWLALRAADGRAPFALVLAGVLLGAGAGLKLAALPIAFGLVLASPLLFRAGRVRCTALLGAGAALGLTACAVPWMLELMARFGNPLYPQFAGLFPGPMAPPFDVRDSRFLPGGALDALLHPLKPLLDWRAVSDIKIRDARVPALYLALLAAPLWWRSASREVRWLAVAAIGAGVAWTTLFGYYRYLLAWEVLAPVLLTALIARSMPYVALGVLAVLALSSNPPDWDRVAFGARYVDVTWPPQHVATGALVVFADHEPTAYLATVYPRRARFVRAASNFHGPGREPFGVDRAVAAHVDVHTGPLFAVQRSNRRDVATAALERHALALDVESCATIASNLEPPAEPAVEICRVVRVRSQRPRGG